MKIFLLFLFITISITARSQQDSLSKKSTHGVIYQHGTVIATASLGFVDFYKQYYSVPPGFEKNNTSGYALLYGKLEYALNKKVSIAVAAGYDVFVYNYNQLYTGYTGTIKRYHTNDLRTFNLGVIAFYHLGSIIRINHLDPFIGVGASLNNIRQSEYPQGDTTIIKTEHKVTPYLKAGARYYISQKFSLFGDVGYDQQSIFSLGASCRFQSGKKSK